MKKTNEKIHDPDDLQGLREDEENNDNEIDIYRSSFNMVKQKKTSTSHTLRIFTAIFIVSLLSLAIYFILYKTPHLSDSPSKISKDSSQQIVISNSNEESPEDNDIQISKNGEIHIDQDRQAQLTRKVEQLQEKLKQFIPDESSDFVINPEFWTFQKENPNYFESLVLQNNRRFAKISNFSVNVLTKDNYKQYLSKKRGEDLQHLFKQLRQKMITESSNLKHHIDAIEKRLILLHILYERGGIMVNDVFTITQNFDWIKQAGKNPYINRGNAGAKPRVLGFYAPQYSSKMTKYKKIPSPSMEEVEKNMVLIPTLQNYFLAAESKAEFILRLLQEITDILKFPKSISEDIAKKRYKYIAINEKDVYYEYLKLASQRVLLKKQKQLDQLSKGKVTQTFAIDYYGLNLINCYYGPYKTKVILKSVQTPKKIQSVARFDIKQYEASVGPLRYIKFTTMPRKLNQFLLRMRDNQNLDLEGRREKGIMKGSYLQLMYYPNANQSFIYKNAEKSIHNQNAPKWSSLPKIIWFYWDSGLSNITAMPAEVFLCILNLRKMAAASGFEIRQVNRTNLKKYMDEQTLKKIESTLVNGKMQRFVQSQSDLYRLVLLYKYGGVYIDAATITVQNFDWLVDIAKFPSQYIYNRFGRLPSVLLLWNPNFGGQFEWQINEQYGTKVEWRLSYLNGFIAADKGSELLKDWFNVFIELFMKPVQQVIKAFDKCGISKFKWTSERYQYLFGMDVAKCVLGRKQQELKGQNSTKWHGSMDYYKLWTMSSFLGLFKFRDYTNYDNNDRMGEHYYLTRYPQEYVEGIIGKIHFFIKIIHIERVGFASFLKNNSGSFLDVTHSQSIFRKYLYDQNYVDFEEAGDKVIIKAT